jgi:hypothetical protein
MSDRKQSDTSTQELRREQAERRAEERERVPDSVTPDEEDQHRRRADKAAYLERKLAERERAERDAETP